MGGLAQAASALASFLPTSLIGIVLDYARSPVVVDLGYRCDRLVCPGSAPDIQATQRAFAVRTGDGSVACWGDAKYGGDCSLVQERLKNVKAICATSEAFAAIVGEDNTVICWGNPDFGGDCSAVASELTQVEGICGTNRVFAALKRDGTVVTWGNGWCLRSELKGVKTISSAYFAFAAVLHDGTVEAWGDPGRGGLIPSSVKERLKQQVQCISGNLRGFAALLRDGAVVTWGIVEGATLANGLTEVDRICAAFLGFAAFKKDGTVVTWGHPRRRNVQVQGELGQVTITPGTFATVRSDGSVVTFGDPADGGGLTDVVALRGNPKAFAALRKDGTVATGGHKDCGAAVQGELQQVVALSSTWCAFAALRSDGKVVTWGDKAYGGDNSSVPAIAVKAQKVRGCEIC